MEISCNINFSDNIRFFQTQYLSQPKVEFGDSTYSSCIRTDKNCKV